MLDQDAEVEPLPVIIEPKKSAMKQQGNNDPDADAEHHSKRKIYIYII